MRKRKHGILTPVHSSRISLQPDDQGGEIELTATHPRGGLQLQVTGHCFPLLCAAWVGVAVEVEEIGAGAAGCRAPFIVACMSLNGTRQFVNADIR